MNYKPDKTEELLQKGKGIVLSSDERDDIKAQLLSYAQFHGKKTAAAQKRGLLMTWWFRSASAFAVALFALTGTGYASMDSLPGEPLYAVKVHMVEEIVQLTIFGEEERLRYSVQRIEARLGELHELAAREALTPSLMRMVEEQMDEHLTDMDATLDADTDDSLDTETVLRETTTVAAALRATETFLMREFTDASSEIFDDAVDTAVLLHQEELAEFVETHSAEEVEAHISENLSLIEEELAGSVVPASTTERITEHLEDMSDALEAGSLEDASVQASEAMQRVLIEDYLEELMEEPGA